MGSLSSFVPEDQDFLASVFYKIGVWISHIDDDGDCTADAEEEKVLMSVLEMLSKKHKAEPLIAQMTAEAARQTGNHQRWAENASDTAIPCAVKAAKMLKSQMSNEDFHAYKSASAEVARAVATAFREGDAVDQSGGEKVRVFLLKILSKDVHEEQNISPAEDSALTELHQALEQV